MHFKELSMGICCASLPTSPPTSPPLHGVTNMSWYSQARGTLQCTGCGRARARARSSLASFGACGQPSAPGAEGKGNEASVYSSSLMRAFGPRRNHGSGSALKMQATARGETSTRSRLFFCRVAGRSRSSRNRSQTDGSLLPWRY